MSDQLGTNNFTDKGLQIWGYGIHTVFQVVRKRLSELNKLDDSFCPLVYLKLVSLIHVHSHRDLGSFDDLLSLFLVKSNSLDLVLHFVSDFFSVGAEEEHELGVNGVVVDNFCHFGEVPCEPLLESHAEGVNVFVHLLDEGDGLDDGLVLSVDILGASGAGIAVTKTELGSLNVTLIDL
jgi:hypothetical protein